MPAPLIIPAPASVTWGDGELHLPPPVRWSVACPEGEERLVRAVRDVLRSLGVTVEPGVVQTHTDAWAVIRIGSADPPERLPGSTGDASPQWRADPEGYRLVAAGSTAEIAAPTVRGAFYGLQTLRQILRRLGTRLVSPAAEIKDWPSLRFRGAHWFPSASGVPFHRRLIRNVLAPHKLNHAVIQCEAARWDSHPEIAAPNSISKKDLRELVDLCRENYIEPIPLINTPGHAEWLFRNDQHFDLAEDPATPYAYCVSNPKSLAVVQEILSEAIEVFRPRYFHLGHDEVTLRGRFPHPECPRCAGGTATELVLAHVRQLSSWLGERNIRPIIWGDTLLAKGECADDSAHAPSAEEARARRAGLPPEILIADWHYGEGRNYPSLDLFRREGLETIAVTWEKPLNIYHFSRAARAAGAEGLLQSTWCGHFPDEEVLSSAAFPQFSAFILAAEYAWSARDVHPDRLPYNCQEVFNAADAQ